jgi:CRISPR system Cascade subunit CasD
MGAVVTEATLVLRLAGPLQSWGGASKFKVRGTLGFPTYSGLIGMFSAAYGFGRFDDKSRELFENLSLTVRVDRKGIKIRDYQTVGPRASGEWQVPLGNGRQWKLEGEPATDVTERYYLSDSSFTVFVTGDEFAVRSLGDALRSPKWQLSLGRKTCVPDFPLVLGVLHDPIEELLTSVPFVDVNTSEDFELVNVQVHWLSSRGAEHLEPAFIPDAPRGPHPQNGYEMRRRFIDRFSFAAPRVRSRDVLLSWVSDSE